MSSWTEQELTDIGAADELRIAPLRPDGSLHPSRIIWVVRHGDDLYVRSVNGPDGGWFRGAAESRAGRISVGDIEVDVTLEDADHALDDQIDEEYRRKYGRSSSSVDHINSPGARSTTIRLERTSGD